MRIIMYCGGAQMSRSAHDLSGNVQANWFAFASSHSSFFLYRSNGPNVLCTMFSQQQAKYDLLVLGLDLMIFLMKALWQLINKEET